MPQHSTWRAESIPGSPRWWQWPIIFALDAPAVVLAWQAMLAQVVDVTLRPHQRVLLGVSVWLAYSADRWIEGWRLSVETVRTQRHYFLLRWRWSAFCIWLLALAGGLGLAMARLTVREWLASLSILVPTLLYVLSHQFLHRGHLWRLPKELCVATLIALGAVLYPASHATDRLHLLVAPTGLFMLLCLANCLLISSWEREIDLHQGQKSLALQFAHWQVIAFALPYAIFTLGLGLALWSTGATRIAAVCGAASALLLAMLNSVQPKLGRELTHLLADVVLLTPWLVYVFV